MSETFIKIDSLQHLEISRQTYPTNRSKIRATTFILQINATQALVQARIGHLQLSTNASHFLKLTFVIRFEILRLRSVKDVNKRRKLFASFPTFRFQMWFLFCFVIVCILTSQKNEANSLHVVAVVVVNLSVRSSWWYYMSFFCQVLSQVSQRLTGKARTL